MRNKLESGSIGYIVDFAIDHAVRSAITPNVLEIKRLPFASCIGNNGGEVVRLSTGLQSLEGNQGELLFMSIFASTDKSGEIGYNTAYFHGKSQEIKEKAILAGGVYCPGSLFDCDCGCREQIDATFNTLYQLDADAAVCVYLDSRVDPKQDNAIAADIYKNLGVTNYDFMLRNIGFGTDCSVRSQLREVDAFNIPFEAPNGDQFVFTHAIPVTFRDGNAGTILAIDQLPGYEKKGIARKLKHHYALVHGDIHKKTPVIRYHSACKTAELGGNGCDCRFQRMKAIDYILENGSGVLVIADEEGMDLGLVAKMFQTFHTLGGEADLLTSRETFLGIPGDLRNYSLVSVIREILGLEQVMLASNNLSKKNKIERHGVEVIGQYPMMADVSLLNPRALADIKAKQDSGRYKKYHES